MKRVRIENFPELDYATNESLNTLCTNLVFMGDSVSRILVTSCRADEGKSFISMSIMRTLASMGYSVVLVDADLRQSVLASKYDIRYPENAQGLIHYLSRGIPIDDFTYATNIPGAYIIPTGCTVINSMQLLNSVRFEELMEQLAEKVDYVIVDTPPVGTIVDAAMVAKSCDGAVLVVASNVTSKQEVVNAKQQIELSGCPVIGAVLNKLELDRSSSKYYYRSMYSSYESNDSSSGKRGKAARKS